MRGHTWNKLEGSRLSGHGCRDRDDYRLLGVGRIDERRPCDLPSIFSFSFFLFRGEDFNGKKGETVVARTERLDDCNCNISKERFIYFLHPLREA